MKSTGVNIATSTMLAADQSTSSEIHGMKGLMPPVRMNTIVTDMDINITINALIRNPRESPLISVLPGQANKLTEAFANGHLNPRTKDK